MGKYFKYAIGEIILVVIGILIALQINNWNENRKQIKNFKLIVEQAYNDIDIDVQNIDYKRELTRQAIAYIDQILDQPDSISDVKLAYMLFYVDYGLDANESNNFSASLYNQNLSFTENDEKQLKLGKEISDYINWKRWNRQAKSQILTPILTEAGLPIPDIVVGLTQFDDFSGIDPTFFSKDQLSTIRELIKTEKIQNGLKTLKADKILVTRMDFYNGYRDGLSILKLIKEYHPQVRLLYDKVGIIGTAIEGYSYEDNRSLPMRMVNSEQSIWEIKHTLKKGTLKFRTRDSWNESWGGEAFPKGRAVYYWENIPIPKEGTYRIVLNLTDKTYEFFEL